MSTPTLRRHIKNLVTWLLHAPDPEMVTTVVTTVMAEISGTFTWRAFANALNKVAGRGNWDTAMLVAHTLDSRIASELRGTIKSLNLKILANPDERSIAAKVFSDSQLKKLLSGGTQTDLVTAVTARTQFLKRFFNQLTTQLFFPRKVDFYRIALFQAKIHPSSWIPFKRYEGQNGSDDYWSEAYTKLLEGCHRILPQNLSAFFVRTIKHEILKSIDVYARTELSGD